MFSNYFCIFWFIFGSLKQMMSTHRNRKKYLLKLVVIGPSGVGKTCIQKRYVFDYYRRYHRPTIGADFLCKDILINDDLITVQIWDTCGMERFQSLSHAFYRGADICVLVFDANKDETFNKIEHWRQTFLKEVQPDKSEIFPFLLLGNKYDLIEEKKQQKIVYKSKYEDVEYMVVHGYCKQMESKFHLQHIPIDLIIECTKFVGSVNSAEQYAAKYGMIFYQTSAKWNINIEQSFQDIVTKTHLRLKNESKTYGYPVSFAPVFDSAQQYTMKNNQLMQLKKALWNNKYSCIFVVLMAVIVLYWRHITAIYIFLR
eukprot:400316_1